MYPGSPMLGLSRLIQNGSNGGKMGITGTGTEYNIPVVPMKLVSVTRFSPSLDPDTLCAYLTERLGKMVTF